MPRPSGEADAKPLASEGACDRGAKSIASPDHEADAARRSQVAHRPKLSPRKTGTASTIAFKPLLPLGAKGDDTTTRASEVNGDPLSEPESI
jgi:hypothetical protein